MQNSRLFRLTEASKQATLSFLHIIIVKGE